MATPDLIADIKNALFEFIGGLNWTFIFMFGLIVFGIKNEPEFEWYNERMKKSKMGTWLAGFITMLLFILFKYLENPAAFGSEYVSTLLRSFMMTIILSRVVNGLIKTYIDKKINEHNNKTDK